MRPQTRRRRLAAAGLAVAALAGMLTQAGTAGGKTGFAFTRYAGSDRYDTARLVAVDGNRVARTVLIASGENFPDALAGSFLAGNLDAPILLTQRDTLPVPTSQALATLRAKDVILLGGTSAISIAVENRLATTASTDPGGGNLSVTRIAGTDRWDTAKLIATRSGTTVGAVDGTTTAIVASGASFADALSGGPPAAASKLPVLLTERDRLPEATKSAIVTRSIGRVLLLGGTGAVSGDVENELRAIGNLNVDRIFGPDRTATATAVADYALRKLGFTDTHVELALGSNFPDALAAGPHGGRAKTAVLLSDTPNALTTATKTWLSDHSPTLEKGHVFGGTAVISPTLEAEAARLAAGDGSSNLYTVTPTEFATKQASTATLAQGQRQCSAGVPVSTTAVDLALFASSALTTTPAGKVQFADADGDGKADLTIDGTGGVIRSARGTANPANPDTNHMTDVVPENGAVPFTIDSASIDDVVAVVFADRNGNNALDLTGTGKDPKDPSEVFGVGCRTRWLPPDASPGPITPAGVTVLGVDKVQHLFWTTTATYRYRTTDSYPGSSFAAFEGAISPGDLVRGSVGASGVPSSWNLTDDAPAVPANVKAAEKGRTITVSWDPVAGVDGYRIYRCEGNFCTANLKLIASVGPAAKTYDDTGLTVDQTYTYYVVAVDEGDESGYTGAAVATARGTDAPVIDDVRVTTDSGSSGPDGKTGPGDVIRFIFSEPMHTNADDAGSTFRVRDASNTTLDVTCGSGTGATTCSLQGATTIDGKSYPANQVLIVTLGTVDDLTYPVSIIAVGVGFKDAGGTGLNLSGSPDSTIDRDTVKPLITKAEATDANLAQIADTKDTHRFTFNEPMGASSAADGASYVVRDSNGTTATITCGEGTDPNKTVCALSTDVLTVTLGPVPQSAPGADGQLTYPLTILSMNSQIADRAGNEVNLAASTDTTINLP